MGEVEVTIAVYERLRKKKFRIVTENGIEIIISFEKEYYHHLVGFHYLTDLVGVAEPLYGKARFYKQILNRNIKEETILRSAKYAHISERIQFFPYLEEILSESDCKIIIDFDPRKAQSDIEARFFLFKREGNPLNKEPVTYYAFFIGYDEEAKEYYPATYLVEHSKKYIDGQNMLDCKVEVLEG